MNYQPTQHVSIDETMVHYFGKHGAKQYIHSKAIMFGFKLWVMAAPLGYCIRFCPYTCKDSILQGYENIGLGFGASAVASLVSKLSEMQTSNYHIVMDNCFTSWGTWATWELLQQERWQHSEWKMLHCEIWLKKQREA